MSSAVEELTERAHGVGVVFQRLDNRSNTQQRACPFQASQQEELFEVPMLLLTQALFIAKQCFQLQVGHKKEVIEKGPGYPITFCDFRHFPVDTLMQPREHDNMDTGLCISIWASRKLHRVASGWWWMVTNRHDSMLQSPSYHRQGFR